MPNVIAANSLLQFVVACQQAEQTAINTFWARVQTLGVNPVTDADLAAQFGIDVAPIYKNLISNDSTFLGVSCAIFNSNPRLSPAVSTSSAGPGIGGTPTLPRQTAGLVRWHTGFMGHASRGRTHLPFPSNAANTADGTPTAAYATDVSPLEALIISPYAVTAGGRTSTIRFGVRSKVHLTITDITAAVFVNAWGTQKSRGSFGRPNLPPF
jgi:hypothetical protein